MVSLELVRANAKREWSRDVNQLVDRDRGNLGGYILLRGYDGTRKDAAKGGAVLSSGQYPLDVQSPGGKHAAFVHSSTAAAAAPTSANAVVLITDDGLGVGHGAGLRLYETGGVDYAEFTSVDGGVTVGGSGAQAGAVGVQKLRVYEPVGGDFAELTSADGLLLLGGTGALAGSLSLGALAATLGAIRLPAGGMINARNAENTQNVGLIGTNGANQVLVGDTAYAALTAVQSLTDVRLRIGAVDVVTVAAASAAVDGNLTLVGVGRRILGDFTNATAASRVLLQSSTVNGSTVVGALPNGTSTTTGFVGYAGSNPAATAFGALLMTAAEMQLYSGHTGAAYLPMSFFTSNVRRLAIDAAGAVTVTAINPPTSTLQVTGGSQAKAWAFVTAGGGATLGDSYNVSGVVRNGAGDFTISWNRDFTSGSYALVVALQDNGVNLIWRINGQAAGSADIHFRTTAGVLTDPDGFSVIVFGTLV